MHPFITQSIAAERVRDRQETARHNRDASLARGHRLRLRRAAARTPGTVRLLPVRPRLHMS